MAAWIEDVRDLLAFYQALGFQALPLSVPAAASAGREKGTGSAQDMDALRSSMGDCRLCKLSGHRKNIVFGTGDPNARLMLIGEAPGKEEDIQGAPFVGDAGMLLTRLLLKMGLRREDVYIANIIKCRPPMNRDPEEDEVTACRSFVEQQIAIVRPSVIMTLGRVALQTLMNAPKLRITAARGRFLDYNGIPVMPTFHPAYLLRNPRDKVLTWSDAQKVMAKLGLAAESD